VSETSSEKRRGNQEPSQRRRSVNAVLLPDDFPGRVYDFPGHVYRIRPAFDFALIIDCAKNYPDARPPLMPFWVTEWSGELESPSRIVWVGFTEADAARWIVAQPKKSRVCIIDRSHGWAGAQP
jgi:hypothetical protein